MRDTDLKARAQAIADLVDANLTKLAQFSITPEKAAQLKAAIAAYSRALVSRAE